MRKLVGVLGFIMIGISAQTSFSASEIYNQKQNSEHTLLTTVGFVDARLDSHQLDGLCSDSQFSINEFGMSECGRKIAYLMVVSKVITHADFQDAARSASWLMTHSTSYLQQAGIRNGDDVTVKEPIKQSLKDVNSVQQLMRSSERAKLLQNIHIRSGDDFNARDPDKLRDI